MINYKIIGEGFPIVFLHGWTLDHQVLLRSMEPVFSNREGWKRIYIDLPGMGDSAPADDILNSDDILKKVLELLDQLIPDEPFLVVGQSYGGYLARGAAYLRREQIRGIMLLCPLMFPNYADRCLPEHRVLKADPDLMLRLSPEDATHYAQAAVVHGEREWERYRDDVIIPSQKMNVKFIQYIRENGYALTFDVDNVQPYEYPALVITGRQDAGAGFKDALRLMDNYPRGTFAVVDMAGHYLQIERQDVFESLMNEWLERIEISLR
ncbi:alpha/beta fold hydrolase [Paenibacillus sp. 481]|uniref:alpha/beta fold hydrolase n=1 Tax=Paenibacillus sp. 481 TaxID=2835869 RepID=UPI002FC2E718